MEDETEEVPMYSTMKEDGDEEPHLWEEMGCDNDNTRRRSSSVSIEMRSVSFDEEEEQRPKHVCERITSTVMNAAKGTEEIFKNDDLESHLLLNKEDETEDEDDEEDTPLCSPSSFSPKTARTTYLNIDTQDLDKLFTQIYEYYREHGFVCILASRLSELITIGFTIALSTFLSLFVQWSELLKCEDESSCKQAQDYIKFEYSDTCWDMFVTVYFLSLSTYWLYKFLLFFPTMCTAYRMRSFYRNRLHINSSELETMRWSEIVDRLIRLQQSGTKIQITKSDLDAHDIASRILRKDNYLVGMFNRDVFDLHVPGLVRCVLFPFFVFTDTKQILTKHMEWNLRRIVLDYVFDRHFAIRLDFLRNPDALRRRFRIMAVLNFLLLPFILIFIVVSFFLRHANEFHSNRDFMGPRDWTTLATWKFRDFNELPHVFRTRMIKTRKFADRYVAQFQVPLLVILSRCVSFVIGGLLALLLCLTLLDENVPLHVEYMDRNLLWWIAVLSGIIAISRSFIPKRTDEEIFEPETPMKEVASLTHFMPPSWIRKCRSRAVYTSFLQLYQTKLSILISEVISVLVVPFVLFFSCPRCCDDIVHFVREFTTHVDGLGHVCTYSQFDMKRYGHPSFVGAVRESEGASPRSRRARESMSASNYSQNGKMEKSFLNFVSQHPKWQPRADNGASVFLQQLGKFRMDMMRDINRNSLSVVSTPRSETKGSISDMLMSNSLGDHANSSRLAQSLGHMESDTCYTWLDRYFEDYEKGFQGRFDGFK